MAKFIIDITNYHPELKEAWKWFEELTYRRAYSQVFSDLIERMLSRQTAKFENGQFVSTPFIPRGYSNDEITNLDNIIFSIEKEYAKRVWFRKEKGERQPSHWYDPLGALYETCSSRSQKSVMGQYFTPRHIVQFMAEIALGDLVDKPLFTMNEPACGSGRFGIAAGTYIGSRGIPNYICQNDLDSLCAKMTAINITYNGIVGEITCGDGLDIEGNTFRFDYKICPLLSFFDQKYWNSIRFQMYRTTRKWAEFQYVAIPVTYEQTYISKVNTRTLELMEQRAAIIKEEEKATTIKELKAQVQENLKGTLFEADTSQLDNIRLGKPKPKAKKTVTKKQKTEQPKLF
ncbi:MAG: N-6 DNA methylase [Bacteroidota bacterium]